MSSGVASERGTRVAGTDGDGQTITVPPTPEGVAAGLSHLSAALETTGPARSHPSMRGRPPALEVGEQLSIPESVRDDVPETGIELHVPPELNYLFVVAPLAYYLGAEVELDAHGPPRLLVPETGIECRFRELPTFQHGVGRVLQRVFFLDSLVREHAPPARRQKLLDRFGLDAERMRDLRSVERLGEYFWLADADLDEHLPEWQFSTYADPEMENVQCLPDILDSLSLVYLPEATELGEPDLLDRTLTDFYRSGSPARHPVQSVDVLDPELQAGQVHGWLAAGTPIDAFKMTPRAVENRRTYEQRHGGTDELDVTVVLNDDAMREEHAAVADIYRERAADRPLSVAVRERLTTRELADVFATPTDFVHYIGHCDRDGLACPDGRFSAATLDACRTRTFFLNACGSYHEGVELVEHGSVGGAVTLSRVLDEQAAKVGTAFARLLVHGFGLEPAMQLARRRVMMGKDYAVVGDGTYTLTAPEQTPVVGWLESHAGGYELTCEAAPTRRTGGTFQPPCRETAHLTGTATTQSLDTEALAEILTDGDFPVIYGGDFHWSSELVGSFD